MHDNRPEDVLVSLIGQVQPTPNPFINPCADSSDKASCYRDELGKYGVIVPDNEFTGENVDKLGVVLSTVHITSVELAGSVNGTARPEQVFRDVFGEVIFKFDPNEDLAVTDVPNDTTEGRQAATITLVEDSFGPFQQLDERFVIAHELGHVFHNRHNNARYPLMQNGKQVVDPAGSLIDEQVFGTDQIVYQYAIATSADWYNTPGRPHTASTLRGSKELEKYVDENGNPLDIDGNLVSESGKPQAYYIPQYWWIAGSYSSPDIANLFPNESDPNHPSPHPREGFADTFANFILNPDKLPDDESRLLYFNTNFDQWIEDIRPENKA